MSVLLEGKKFLLRVIVTSGNICFAFSGKSFRDGFKQIKDEIISK